MTNTIAIFGLLVVLMAIGMPVGVALGLTVLSFMFIFTDVPLESVALKMFTGIEKFEIMAIPFFILAGNFLTHGGVARRLIGFATSLVGHWHGGLGLAGVLACALFAAVSGSSPATVVAIGSILLPAMAAQGFHNYPMEWWHYTFRPEPSPDTLYDVPVTAPEDSVRDARIDQLMQRYEGDVPGASLLVLKDGEALVRRGYGRSDLATGIEAGPGTAYRLASVSKQFTATSILLLAQDGKLGIDDPVRKWLPSLPRVADKITLRHLLTHTSGLIDYEDLMVEPYEGQILDAGVLDLLAKENRLYFTPGSAYRYSNSAYALLALVVERASEMRYPQFLQARIFTPLGMSG